MNLKSRIRYNKQIYIKLQFISRRLEGKSLKKKLLFCIYSINGGGSRGGPPPLLGTLRSNDADDNKNVKKKQ